MSYLQYTCKHIALSNEAMKAHARCSGRPFRPVLGVLLMAMMMMSSCKRFLEIEQPKSSVGSDVVFESDVTATSALTGIYARLLSDQSYASGHEGSLVGIAGLAADELILLKDEQALRDFQLNEIEPANRHCETVWRTAYKTIFEATNILEKLEDAPKITPATKAQLRGEALFIRAFTYFYLVNTFGDVPLVLITDYNETAKLPRVAVNTVYDRIIADAEAARASLREEYPTTGRVRPNASVVTAFLARVHLFRENWAQAAEEATKVLSEDRYQLEPNLNDVFLATSKEAIWQFMPVIPGYNTHEAQYFSYPAADFSLSEKLVHSFDAQDLRLQNWMFEDNLFFAFKYKVKSSPTVTEYPMVLRLAEQYLIRAEARVKNNDPAGAIEDVNAIRVRANATLLDENSTTEQIISAIALERYRELFSEWGHRWYDLKRTGQALDVLRPIKADITANDLLFPVPPAEFIKNPHMGQQNPGY